jgi:hypothetical protein
MKWHSRTNNITIGTHATDDSNKSENKCNFNSDRTFLNLNRKDSK